MTTTQTDEQRMLNIGTDVKLKNGDNVTVKEMKFKDLTKLLKEIIYLVQNLVFEEGEDNKKAIASILDMAASDEGFDHIVNVLSLACSGYEAEKIKELNPTDILALTDAFFEENNIEEFKANFIRVKNRVKS